MAAKAGLPGRLYDFVTVSPGLSCLHCKSESMLVEQHYVECDGVDR
jgi:hypothetical protein